ncbi:MAG TPA: glycosyltransferase family 4 protein [Acidimicrobiia bacterium]|nr:glycosyltransferase family 4 protein [Acidimicrobiia bacterium]
MTAASGSGIHQIVVAASPGDAITNLALDTRRLLREIGPSEIYAHLVAPELQGDILPLTRYGPRSGHDLLIFHASMGQPDVQGFLASRREPIVLVYHNVTPGRFFDPYDPLFADLLARGRREVEALRPQVVGAIAVSEYNARELEAMGYRDVRVIPPVVDVRRLARVAPRESTMQHFASLGRPIMLSVGQLMPHKRPDFLVEMMHIAETYLESRALLLLVGHQRLERFTRAIREQIQELDLEGVHLVGAVDDADLAAMYRSAHAVVTASEHEGFCIPLLEAMTFSKPVVARACAAIPETVGDAALLLPPEQGPTFFAEAVCELFNRPPLQRALVDNGNRRLVQLEARPPDVAMLEVLLEVA